MKYASPQNRVVFNQTVWQIVRQIPPGKIATYGQIAMLIPPPSGVSFQDYRAWGRAGLAQPWQVALTMCPGSGW